jgi:hypothetical protein
MIKVFKLRDSEGYVLQTKTQSIFSGTLQKLIGIMREIGINDEEIEYGLVELHANEHDIAEYGINKLFIYSKKVA